jgi:two-component system, NtrC family, sensor histidine kinase GlrK
MAAPARIMRFYYPRSFLKLLFVGFTLIALPLMFALINNAISIDQLSNRSQKAVYQAVQATQSSRQLTELLTAMERSAHQMLILGDRSLLDTYESNRKQFLETAGEFATLPFDREQMQALGEIVRGEAEIFQRLSDPAAKQPQLQQALQGFDRLAEDAQAITARSNELIDREVETMRDTARQARHITLWQLLALIPVVVFLMIGFTIVIARPIRQIDGAIRRLGGGDFNAPVEVSGPEDLQYLGERLEWMRRRLQELEQQKNRFLRHMSHELKTPLTALREGAELMSEEVVGKLTPEQREIAEILRHNSIELQKLIEDLLSYGASQFHKPSLEMQDVNIRHVIHRVLDDQKLAMRAKNLKTDVVAPDIVLLADFEKLRVMLDNLISNAIKFSPSGGAVRVVARRQDDNLELDVSDSGPGVSPEDRARVFEPFYRGDHAADTLVKGTGIGLSVVREYAQLHGGTVEVVADSDPGARVRITLPLRAEPPVAPDRARPAVQA